jgi:hypothetical protein
MGRTGAKHHTGNVFPRCGYPTRMSKQCEIEPLGGHEYLIRVRTAGSTVESRFQATRAVREDLRVDDGDERRLIEATMDFLASRHAIAELPGLVDLDDIADSYPDYLDDLRRRMAAA